MITKHLIISGNVQGIGFRKWMKRQAKHLCITGWVKNREDGAVESVVQGEDTSIHTLLTNIRTGPPLAIVEGVSEELMQDAQQFVDFIVIQ